MTYGQMFEEIGVDEVMNLEGYRFFQEKIKEIFYEYR